MNVTNTSKNVPIPSDNDGIEDDEEFSNEFDDVPTTQDTDVDEDEMWVDETEE